VEQKGDTDDWKKELDSLTAALWNDILIGLIVMVLAWRSAAAKPGPSGPTS